MLFLLPIALKTILQNFQLDYLAKKVDFLTFVAYTNIVN